ncbi:MAG: hypothetical protein JW849_03280, partial [Phycisphaerae bacterium]|nr:hypothetical protein [Phycisphaerae bacterium]
GSTLLTAGFGPHFVRAFAQDDRLGAKCQKKFSHTHGDKIEFSNRDKNDKSLPKLTCRSAVIAILFPDEIPRTFAILKLSSNRFSFPLKY